MIGWNNKYFKESADRFIKREYKKLRFLYMNYGKRDFKFVREFLPDFIKEFKNKLPGNIIFKSRFYPGEGHVPQSSLRHGLTELFKDFSVGENVWKKGLAHVKKYYKELSVKLRCQLKPPLMTLLMLGDYLDSKKKYSEAIKVKHYLIKLYPYSNNGYFSLGESYRKAGKKDKAVKAYEKAYELEPINIYKQKIEVLKKKK